MLSGPTIGGGISRAMAAEMDNGFRVARDFVNRGVLDQDIICNKLTKYAWRKVFELGQLLAGKRLCGQEAFGFGH
jgi:hypothetical protein